MSFWLGRNLNPSDGKYPSSRILRLITTGHENSFEKLCFKPSLGYGFNFFPGMFRAEKQITTGTPSLETSLKICRQTSSGRCRSTEDMKSFSNWPRGRAERAGVAVCSCFTMFQSRSMEIDYEINLDSSQLQIGSVKGFKYVQMANGK